METFNHPVSPLRQLMLEDMHMHKLAPKNQQSHSRVYHCDALAAQASMLLVFPAKAFLAALDQDVAFRRAWQSLLAREVRKLRSQCERLSLNSAAERILHYIEAEGSNGVLNLTLSKKAWAAERG